MRYNVFYGTDSTAYAVCYGATEEEARYQFSRYHPDTAIVRVEEFADSTEPDKELLDLIGEADPEEVIRYLIDAIEDAGVTHRVAGYLYQHGFGREDEPEE